ncbi:hypothetical protein LCGC14_2586810 [marine sediment metagenome]|uniref:Uncharacterized protein n=1 Tax=marine sediment metagenome TaxID=412755 RepID=A0A0F9B0S0_9ZZZZ
MIEIADAINNLAVAVNSLGAGLVGLGIVYFFFKNMGGQK